MNDTMRSGRTSDAGRLDRTTVAGIVICGICVAAFSSYSQFQTACTAGVPVQLGWVFPVATDATAFVATRVWLSPRYSSGTRRYAAAVASACVALSFGGAAIHLVLPTLAPWWLRLAIGGLPSVALGVLIHLGALLAAERATTAAARPTGKAKTPREPAPKSLDPAPAPPVADVPAPEVVSTGSPVVTLPATLDKRAAMLHYITERDGKVTGAALDREFGTSNYGRVVLRQWRDQQPNAQAVGE